MKLLSFSLIMVPLMFSLSCSSGPENKKATEAASPKLVYTSPRGDAAFFSQMNLDFPGLEDVKKFVSQGDFTNAKAAYLDFRRTKSKAKWDINPSDKPQKAESPDYPQAEKIMKHLIPASDNAPEAFLGDDINWEYNPVEPTQPYFTKEWTWCNVNRMPFWNTLGRAYWSTLDEKYAKEWVSEMIDWVEDNPVPLEAGTGNTLTWRTIESGIRMAGSWMNSYYYFLNSPSLTPEANVTFVTGVIEHAQRLEKITLEQPERSGNWITMECNGLGTIGILFPELKCSPAIVKEAFDRLNSELDKQVYPDGAEVELTTGYHQVSRSNFMELAKLAQANNIALPADYLAKLKKMYQFNLYLMDPKGILPPFNDADPTRTESSLREAYEIWKDPEFLWGATLGKEGQKPGFDSYYFNWAGYYVMRSGWNTDDNCMYFDAGPVGYGHEHEDMLNMYLYSKGEILLTEPGTYSYDLSKWRRYILSTPSHNTIIVDGKEQHRADIRESRLATKPTGNPWITNKLFDYGSGTYSAGYQENVYKPVQYMPKEYVGPKDTSVTHTRHLVFLKPWYYIAVDFLEGTGTHQYDAHFHLNAPDAEINNANKAVKTLRSGDIQLGLYPLDTTKLKVKIVKGQEDPILGWNPDDHTPIPTVVYSKNQEAPASFSTLIYPYSGQEPAVSYAKFMAGQPDVWGEKIVSPYETATIVIRKKASRGDMVIEPEQGVTFTASADLVITRKPAGTNSFRTGFGNLSLYNDGDIAFSLANPGSMIMTKGENGETFICNDSDQPVKVSFTSPKKKNLSVPGRKWIIVNDGKVKLLDGQAPIL